MPFFRVTCSLNSIPIFKTPFRLKYLLYKLLNKVNKGLFALIKAQIFSTCLQMHQSLHSFPASKEILVKQTDHFQIRDRRILYRHHRHSTSAHQRNLNVIDFVVFFSKKFYKWEYDPARQRKVLTPVLGAFKLNLLSWIKLSRLTTTTHTQTNSHDCHLILTVS